MTPRQGHVIGQELERHHVKDWGEQPGMVPKGDDRLFPPEEEEDWAC